MCLVEKGRQKQADFQEPCLPCFYSALGLIQNWLATRSGGGGGITASSLL
jgi:hypothetical protein